jgi:succinyl-CoA synthetase alpha subunit
VTTFTAEALAQNTPMLHLFADAGLPVQRHYDDGVAEVTIPLPSDGTGITLDAFLDAVARRERTADAASLRHVLAPESVVVIGASRRTGTVGRAIVDNIRTCGYAGRLYAVRPRALQLAGVHCVQAISDLPEAPDLALIAVPAPAVIDVAEDCGRLGTKALAVIASGLDTTACADLLAVCRRHGMRLVGPDSFGIAVPGLGLDATFAASHPRPGVAGLVTQSGGVGLAMVDQLSRLGIGISSFASVGRKLDVSSNDMLLWWEQDEVTKLAVLYIESFGNPRKFARTARRVGARIPVLTVHAGRFAAGLAGREALFEQAGIIAAPGGRRRRRPGGHHRRDIRRSLPVVPGAGRGGRDRTRRHRARSRSQNPPSRLMSKRPRPPSGSSMTRSSGRSWCWQATGPGLRR